MAVELNNSTTNHWNEVDASNTSSPPDGAPAGMFPNQSEGVWRGIMATVKRAWDRSNGTVTTTGSSNAYVYTPVNTSYPTTLVQGEVYTFKVNFANTGAATLNINSLGATNIFKKGISGVVALTGGEIQSGDLVSVAYDGAQFQMLSRDSGIGVNTLPVFDKIVIQKFNSSGTYTPTTGMAYCVSECWGGGGAGGAGVGTGGGSTSAGGSGGAGSYSRKVSTAAAISTSQAVTIGAAGAGGTGNGGNGGTTSVGSICVANGGSGGGSSSGTFGGNGGVGGTAGTGDIAAPGDNGLPGLAWSSGIGAIYFPPGASTLVGTGGIGIASPSSGTTVGNTASGFGAGGSAGAQGNVSATGNGGSGTAGFVIITEFLSV